MKNPKKRIFFCMLVLVVTPLALGCMDDGDFLYRKCLKEKRDWAEAYDFSSLTEEQESSIEEAVIDGCIDFYNNMPVCKDEFMNEIECIDDKYDMSDFSCNIIRGICVDVEYEKYENEVASFEHQCVVEGLEVDDWFYGPGYYACMIRNGVPCSLETEKKDTCMIDNYDILSKYANDYSFDKIADKMLEKWGLKSSDNPNVPSDEIFEIMF